MKAQGIDSSLPRTQQWTSPPENKSQDRDFMVVARIKLKHAWLQSTHKGKARETGI